MELLNKISLFCNRILVWMAAFFLMVMVALTSADIIMRGLWKPIPGTVELMGYIGALVTAFALGYTQISRANVAVDILVQKFSPGTQKVLNGVNYILCTSFFFILGWQVAKQAFNLWETGEVTETLRIIYYPFTFGVALGCLLLAFVLLVDLLILLADFKQDQ